MLQSILTLTLVLGSTARASNTIGTTADGSLWDFIEASQELSDATGASR